MTGGEFHRRGADHLSGDGDKQIDPGTHDALPRATQAERNRADGCRQKEKRGCLSGEALEVAGPVTFTGNQAGGEERKRFSVQHNEQ
ncbi:hypothetical protein D3C75_1077910 [compost metagenome]